MYALNATLAIDGKAMYFGGQSGRRVSDFGPRTSDLGRQTSDVGASDFCPRALKKLATDFTDSHG